MGNNVHLVAVDSAGVMAAPFDPEDFMGHGLTWCCDTFERSWAFWGVVDEVIAPYLAPNVLAILRRETSTVSDHALDRLRTNTVGAAVYAFAPDEFDELRRAVAQALTEANWGPHDRYEWDMLAADRSAGDFFSLIEFE